MPEVGELIVGAYLSSIKECDLVQYNIKIQEEKGKGEIDVVGINIRSNEAYFCEVATHLITGLQYVKNKKPNNVEKLFDKFSRDIAYANRYFKNFNKHFMLWSAIIKRTKKKNKIWDQEKDIRTISEKLSRKFGITIELFVNDKYMECLQDLKKLAGKITHVPDSTILRLYQIESRVFRHVEGARKGKGKIANT